MTQSKGKSKKITDVDEIAAEAQASLEMIRAAAQQIQQLAAIRNRFEDMAQKYEAMNARTNELMDVIKAGEALHPELRQTAETLNKRMTEEEERNSNWQKEVVFGFHQKLEETQKAGRDQVAALKQQLDESAGQNRRLASQLKLHQVLLIVAILLALWGVMR